MYVTWRYWRLPYNANSNNDGLVGVPPLPCRASHDIWTDPNPPVITQLAAQPRILRGQASNVILWRMTSSVLSLRCFMWMDCCFNEPLLNFYFNLIGSIVPPTEICALSMYGASSACWDLEANSEKTNFWQKSRNFEPNIRRLGLCQTPVPSLFCLHIFFPDIFSVSNLLIAHRRLRLKFSVNHCLMVLVHCAFSYSSDLDHKNFGSASFYDGSQCLAVNHQNHLF